MTRMTTGPGGGPTALKGVGQPPEGCGCALPEETEESPAGVRKVVIAAATTTVTGADILRAIEFVTGIVIGVSTVVTGIAVPPAATHCEDVRDPHIAPYPPFPVDGAALQGGKRDQFGNLYAATWSAQSMC